MLINGIERNIKPLADLSSADLSSANLSYADLSSANLSYADLSSADLSCANLRYADLSSADLSSANLSYADLSSADLSSADLSSADLRYANLSSANLSSADLRYANLCYADLRYANLCYANLTNVLLPSPPALLLLNWGTVSDTLTADLMAYDAANHVNPAAFDRWANDGKCPYLDHAFQRSAQFQEKKELWGKGLPQTALQLVLRLFKEKEIKF